MTVAWGYAYLGFRPHTLASLSNDGAVITRLLERCGFVVFRGGSSDRDSRRRSDVTRELTEHMNTTDGVIYGLTVDGSKGPAYRLKRGGIIVARDCGRPIVLVRTWYRRCLRLDTWDRTAIPLPFNRIHYYMEGPYFPPAGRRHRGGPRALPAAARGRSDRARRPQLRRARAAPARRTCSRARRSRRRAAARSRKPREAAAARCARAARSGRARLRRARARRRFGTRRRLAGLRRRRGRPALLAAHADHARERRRARRSPGSITAATSRTARRAMRAPRST